jgi:hypothetical protein
MQLVNNGFNTFKMNDSIHVQILKVQKRWKKIINLFNNKNEALNCYMCFNIYTNKWNMHHLSNDFYRFKMDDSIYVQMLIFQKM